MGCNCGKKRAAAQPRLLSTASQPAQRYVLTAPDGTETVHLTRQEADLANKQIDYTGSVTKKVI